MLYELIGVVSRSAPVPTQIILTHSSGPSRSRRQRDQRVRSHPNPYHYHHLRPPLTQPLQNRSHSRQPSPHCRWRRPRRHKLGHFSPSQTRPQAGRNLPQWPLLHHALRLERKDTARRQEDTRSGPAPDPLFDGQGRLEVRRDSGCWWKGGLGKWLAQ